MKCYFTNEIKYIFYTIVHQSVYISKYFAIFEAAEKWYFIDHKYSYEFVRFHFFLSIPFPVTTIIKFCLFV